MPSAKNLGNTGTAAFTLFDAKNVVATKMRENIVLILYDSFKQSNKTNYNVFRS